MKKDKRILSHLNIEGNPQMVDVSAKLATARIATAEAIVSFPAKVFKQLLQNNFLSSKGSIFIPP